MVRTSENVRLRLFRPNFKISMAIRELSPRLLPVACQKKIEHVPNEEKETFVSLRNKLCSVVRFSIRSVFTNSFVKGLVKDER